MKFKLFFVGFFIINAFSNTQLIEHDVRQSFETEFERTRLEVREDLKQNGSMSTNFDSTKVTWSNSKSFRI